MKQFVFYFFFVVRTAFSSSKLNLEKVKNLIKEYNEELMPVTWHLDKWWDWCISEDEKKRNRSNVC